MASKKVCQFFHSQGCRNGLNCSFHHDVRETFNPSGGVAACQFFPMCQSGDSCRYAHVQKLGELTVGVNDGGSAPANNFGGGAPLRSSVNYHVNMMRPPTNEDLFYQNGNDNNIEQDEIEAAMDQWEDGDVEARITQETRSRFILYNDGDFQVVIYEEGIECAEQLGTLDHTSVPAALLSTPSPDDDRGRVFIFLPNVGLYETTLSCLQPTNLKWKKSRYADIYGMPPSS